MNLPKQSLPMMVLNLSYKEGIRFQLLPAATYPVIVRLGSVPDPCQWSNAMFRQAFFIKSIFVYFRTIF